jgi:hypothetical protein
MSPDEKERLLALLSDAQRWCQGAEARDAGGLAVVYSDADAIAWDLTGAACRLFGPGRARELFVQIDRQFHGRGPAGVDPGQSEITAMVALQTWNDDARTTHTELLTRLQSLPVRGLPMRPEPGGEPCPPAGDAVTEGAE